MTFCPIDGQNTDKNNRYFTTIQRLMRFSSSASSGSGSEQDDFAEYIRSLSPEERVHETKLGIMELASTLGIEDIEDDKPWREAGLDSLSMV